MRCILLLTGSFFLASVLTDAGIAALREEIVTYSDFNTIVAATSSTSRVYFATDFGITCYDKIESRWALPIAGSEEIAREGIVSLHVDMFDQHLYAQTSQNWYDFDVTFQRWYALGKEPRVESSSRQIRFDGIMYPPESFTWSADGYLIDNLGRFVPLNVVVDDGSGIWWIGTAGYGAGKCSSSGRILTLLPYGLLQQRVNALLDDGDLWISGAIEGGRSGITRFDRDENDFRYVETGFGSTFASVNINCLASGDRELCVGTSGGVYILDKETGQVEDHITSRLGLVDNEILSLAYNGDTLFAGSAQGLSVVIGINSKSRVAQVSEFDGRAVFDMHIVDSSLWVGAQHGVYRLSLIDGSLKKFNDPTLVLAHDAFDIDYFGDDLWMTSSSGALRVNVRTGTLIPYFADMQQTIPREIAVNDTIAVMNSDRGIFIIHYKDDKQPIDEITTDDGLPSPYIYNLQFDGDYLWIGSERGLTRLWWSSPNIMR